MKERKDKRIHNPREEVLRELLNYARIIQRRGTPDEVEAVLPYLRLLHTDLEKLKAA